MKNSRQHLFIGYRLVGLHKRSGTEVLKPVHRRMHNISMTEALERFGRLVRSFDRVSWWTYNAKQKRWVQQHSG